MKPTTHHVLQAAGSDKAYHIRYSRRAKRLLIQITAEGVEIIAPLRTSQRRAITFAEQHAEWIVRGCEDIAEKTRARKRASITPEHYMSGVRVPYRGAMVELVLHILEVVRSSIRYTHSTFQITIPRSKAQTVDVQDRTVSRILERWMTRQLQPEVERIGADYERKLGVLPAGYRVKRQKHLWGSCSGEGFIRLNWKLAYVAPSLLEYVVLHELVHLRYHNHGPRFHGLLKKHMPDYQDRKNTLDALVIL